MSFLSFSSSSDIMCFINHQQDRHQQHKGHRDHRGEEFAHVLALGLVQRAVPNECTEHTLPSLFHADSGVQDSIEDVHHQIDT